MPTTTRKLCLIVVDSLRTDMLLRAVADGLAPNFAALLERGSLCEADLTYADFSQARLAGVDGRGATMFRTRLHGADTRDTRFTDRGRALETDPKLDQAEQWKPQRV